MLTTEKAKRNSTTNLDQVSINKSKSRMEDLAEEELTKVTSRNEEKSQR
jgi:hypothetical protein